MRTIAIINLKGGVAKTTSSINIAYILTQRGYKVLLVDNDKQGDCSRGLNRRTQDGDGIDRIMVDRHPDMDNLIHHTDYANLDIITANLGLLTANTEVIKDPIRPQQDRLKKALQQVSDKYDFCVVDNAPDINVSVINALTAANDVLIPVEVDDNTLEGMDELLNQITVVREELNPGLKNIHCFITKYQKFNQAHLQGAEIIEERYPTMKTKIRFSGVVARSTFMRVPVALHSPRSAAAEDYGILVNEYLDMIGGKE
ncbi:ParA family protein [Blautia luti]|uniref:Sporulation initiation inhibitor protein Soj n=1 Tax=Blautia luti TaxID=89014 RepID=A0A564VJJ9_9FIRM|nr:ParA family protein [Blautia luti]VUX32784.1 Sporulation initiation inhibitor protein Soj [Blautia luti]